MPGVYGGDDVSAIVLDAGSSTTRAGWAGEDTPRAVIPSFYGWVSSGETAADGASGSGNGADGDAMEGVETADGAAANGDTAVADAAAETNADANGNGNGAKSTSSKAVSDWELQKTRAESRRRYVGDAGVNMWRKGAELGNPFEDSVGACVCAGSGK